jgi:hypothetical protein
MVEHVVCNDEIRVRFPAGPYISYSTYQVDELTFTYELRKMFFEGSGEL